MRDLQDDGLIGRAEVLGSVGRELRIRTRGPQVYSLGPDGQDGTADDLDQGQVAQKVYPRGAMNRKGMAIDDLEEDSAASGAVCGPVRPRQRRKIAWP